MEDEKYYIYPEIPPISSKLRDVPKGQIYKVCSRSDAFAESLQPVYDEQKEMREIPESVADVSMEPSPGYMYVNSGICNYRDRSKSTYEQLDFIHMQTVYEQLNNSAMG